MLRRVVLLLLLGLPSLATVLQAEEAPRPMSRPSPYAEAIRDLGSSAERVRAAASRRLIEGLPASRSKVIAALGETKGEARYRLIEVLVEDGSPEAARALLGIIASAEDAFSIKIQRHVLRSATASRALRKARKAEVAREGPLDAGATRRLATLDRLLERAEIEALFLSRMSKTGGTGMYSGQYELLRPHRIPTLDLCLDILYDRPVTLPGLPPLGPFEFLREPEARWSIGEIQGMASHCFAELAIEQDPAHLKDLLVVLDRNRRDTEERWGELTSFWGRRRRTRHLELLAFESVLGLYGDLVVAYYRASPSPLSKRMLASLLDLLRDYHEWSYSPADQRRIAHVLLRVGRYEEAIEAFDSTLGFGSRLAMTYYNLACAYAQWGEKLGERQREQRRAQALLYLELAIDQNWSDTDWLDEDRDLEPIRSSPRFQALRARMVRANAPPDEARGSGAGSGR